MTPLPTISHIPHTCDLCGETIPARVQYAGAIAPNDLPYRAHRACQDVVNATGQPFATIATLSPSDLCEILQAHSADEIVRMVNLRQRITETTP
jgi:hypothetical protein